MAVHARGSARASDECCVGGGRGGGLVILAAGPAAGTGMIFVSNEKSNTITVLGPEDQVVETMWTPRKTSGG
jgi:hypothetical protein